MQQKRNKFAFYGSLRKGHYNYDRLVKNSPGMELVGEQTVQGYKMFDTGIGYPYVVKTGNPTDEVKVELYDIPDESTAYCINRMELGAGYKQEEIKFDDETYTLYVCDSFGRQSKPVPKGDWTAYSGNVVKSF